MENRLLGIVRLKQFIQNFKNIMFFITIILKIKHDRVITSKKPQSLPIHTTPEKSAFGNVGQTFWHALHQQSANAPPPPQPTFFYSFFQFFSSCCLFLSDFVLQNSPYIFYWVQVWTVSRSVQDLKFLRLQELSNNFRAILWCTIVYL